MLISLKEAEEVFNEIRDGKDVEAWRVVCALRTFREAYYKAVNRPSDEGKSKAWMNMPEGTDELPKSTMADDLKRLEKTVSFISDHMVILQGHLCDAEKRIERLEDGK